MMKSSFTKTHFLVVLIALEAHLIKIHADLPKPATSPRTKQQIMADWQRDRFGISIHWNTSSLLQQGSGSWARTNSKDLPQKNKTEAETPAVITCGNHLKFMNQPPVPQLVYDNLFHVFNPTKFNAMEWAKLFKETPLTTTRI